MAYNFKQDLLDTYQSLSDTVQIAWLVVPLVFIFGLIVLIMRHRLERKRWRLECAFREGHSLPTTSPFEIETKQQIPPLEYQKPKDLLE